MNPQTAAAPQEPAAPSRGSGILAHLPRYFSEAAELAAFMLAACLATAPLLGMLSAAELYLRLSRPHRPVRYFLHRHLAEPFPLSGQGS